MIRILNRFIIYLFIFILLSCDNDFHSNTLDLTNADWKVIQGNHLDLKNGKKDPSSQKYQSVRRDKEKESISNEDWKDLPPFPIHFNSFFHIPEQTGFHAVTARLDFSLNADSLFLKMPSALYLAGIGENWEIYLNGILIRSEFPLIGDTQDVSEPKIRRTLKSLILSIPSGVLKEGRNSIQLYLVGESNLTPYVQNDHFGFSQATGFRLATFEQIYDSTSEYFEVILYGIYFIFGIYHILFYITRKRDLYYLYFGIFSFVSSVYFFASSHLIFQKFVNSNSNIDSSFVYRIESSSLILILPAFYFFIQDYFYQKQVRRVIPIAFVSVLFTLFLGVWFCPFSWTHVVLKVSQVTLSFFLFYILFFLVQAVRQKKRDSIKILVGLSVCTVLAVWDLFDSVFKILEHAYPFFKIAYSLFIATIISILVSRYTQLYKDIQLLNEDLTNQKVAFYRFVPADFIRILDKESTVSISIGDSKEKSMTVLFSDIRDFTSFLTTVQPSQAIKFLNDYLSEMQELVYQAAGFVDKFVGDDLLALFPDYNDRADKENFNSADNALESAIRMISVIQSGKIQRKILNSSPWNLEIGIGIHTGSLIMGTVGNHRKIDTNVLGEAVNLTARLQSLTSLYQSKILISHHTYLQLNRMSDVGIRLIDTVLVKGRNQSVDIYEVFEGDSEDLREFKFRSKERIYEGMLEYKAGKFSQASRLFKQLYREEPRDTLSKIYLKRCKLYSTKPPEGNWDGIFRYQTK
ncbi:adenylate/guanylate cyclase domain-containing protein [Leptospira stimsonii]|uniref:Adenylate/guanylate cyclase domain-containing protein n=1 Tax=Leptospira stimsonii TaxID=2202203 RepID=A0ABY2NA42_9LEPT|nr:adenylate/guanylate cyclase domain-containing protein [Leptospira stimsonii]TGK11102.1 adenylate/guanylate cyclase domain-containing protein [Leptospira stimsonii]TGM19088.1 adenylate/guanylate cyclase domain-containing protein [Leptospira stimsonii]